jgi:glycosyltransferase involved in cell wall biosynthesis
MNPTVSVILPTKNRAHYVSLAIQSVLNQTFKDFELLIIDGNSTDDTQKVVEKFSDPRIHFFKQEKDAGVSAARNFCVSRANGTFVAFLDDDDLWLSKKLERQIQAFSNEPDEVGAVYFPSGYYIRTDGKVAEFNDVPLSGRIYPKILEQNFIGNCSSVMVRKKSFLDIGGFDGNLRASEDWDMWIRLAKKYSFDYVNGLQFLYRIHENRLSSRSNSYKRLEAVRVMYKKFLPDIEAAPNKSALLRGWYANFALIYFENGDKKRAIKAYIKAVKEDPGSLNTYLRLVLCLFGLKINDLISKILQYGRIICPK